jgi:hypothetical protein
MACSCQRNKTGDGKPKSYTVTTKSGEKKAYKTEVEAAAAARRLGGSYKAA